MKVKIKRLLWFDVDKERNTTAEGDVVDGFELWFDVDKERNTTPPSNNGARRRLWFDVDKERNTTRRFA